MYKRQATETTIRDTADLKAAQIPPRETEFSEKKHGPKQEICFLLFYLRQISMFFWTHNSPFIMQVYIFLGKKSSHFPSSDNQVKY